MWGDDLALRAAHCLAAPAAPHADEMGGARCVLVVVMRRRWRPVRSLWAGRLGARRGRLVGGITAMVVVLHVHGDLWCRGGGRRGRWERGVRRRTRTAAAAVIAIVVHSGGRAINTSSSGTSLPASLDAFQARVEHGSGDAALERVVELELDRARALGERGHVGAGRRVGRGCGLVRCACASPT